MQKRLKQCIIASLFSGSLTCSLLLSGCSPKAEKPANQFKVATFGLNSGALSDDSTFAVVGSVQHGISLWRVDDQERLFDWNHKSNVDTSLIAADFSPDGQWALTADSHTLALWNVSTGEAPRFWRAPGDILSVQLSRNGGRALLGLSDQSAVLFDIQKGGILRTLNHNNRVNSVALSDDGLFAITGSEDYKAIAWDLQSGKALATQQHNDDVQLVAISPDGSLALSMSKYDKAIVWKTKTGETVDEIPLGAERLKRGLRFTSARFSKDNKHLLTGRPDQIITLWRLSDFSIEREWKVPKKKAWRPTGVSIIDVSFTKEDNTFFALGSNGFAYQLTKVPTK